MISSFCKKLVFDTLKVGVGLGAKRGYVITAVFQLPLNFMKY
jgi:hypothetical protein